MPSNGSGASPDLSARAERALTLLRDNHLLLISGPPGTGKTRLLAEIAKGFVFTPAPVHVPGAKVPIPAGAGTAQAAWLPSPNREERLVLSTVFDQTTKKRDFLRGLEPDVGADSGEMRFHLSTGTLYLANEHALTESGASLVMIDEINRGPAVAVFADSVVAIESDKRLDAVGDPTGWTQYFFVPGDDGVPRQYALSSHLYIVAAMNEADTSVEPLDVAFLRRWSRLFLDPDFSILESYYSVSLSDELPDSPLTADNVYSAAIQALDVINGRITLGRGPEYQIGHGVLMHPTDPPKGSPQDAFDYVAESWTRIIAHVREVFFGDSRSIAAALEPVFSVEKATWAGQAVEELKGSEPADLDDLYKQLRSIAKHS